MRKLGNNLIFLEREVYGWGPARLQHQGFHAFRDKRKNPSKALVWGWPKGSFNNSLLTTAVDENERVFYFYLKPNERFGQLNT